MKVNPSSWRLRRRRHVHTLRTQAPSRLPALECLETRTFLDGDSSGTDLLELARQFFGGDAQAAIDSLLARQDSDDDNDDDDDEKQKKQKKAKDDDGGSRYDAAPLAQISAGEVTAAGPTSHTVTITYADDERLRAATIGTSDIAVTTPGGQTLNVTKVVRDPDSDSNRIVATYTIAAPGGRWDPTDNGAYTVTLKPDQVFDSRNQPVASRSTAFQVNVVIPDTAAPTAAIAAANISEKGDDTHDITVTYTDDVGVNPLSIGPGDLKVVGPGGDTRPVRSVSVSPSSDGTRVTAIYTIGAPGKVWDAGDNGTYTVTLNANQVRDASEKGATASPVSFTVNCPPPDPVDPGFGGGGSSGGSGGSGGGGSVVGGITTPFTAEAVVAQADGKLLIAGRQGNLATGGSQAVLARYNADGSADTTFGTRGRVVTAAGANDAYYAVALAADGKVLVAGTRGGDVLLSRYDAAGKLDATFAKSGSAATDFGTADDAAHALGVGPDGSVIIAAGIGGNYGIAKFQAGGALDPNFGQGGKQMFDLGAADDTPGAVAFQGDKPVVVGTSGGKVAVVRMRGDGEADPTFSGDGLLLVDSLAARADANFADRSTAAAVQADGKLLLANRSAGGDFAVARLNTNGSFDSSFGTNGVSTIDFGGDDDADAVIVQETGEILVIGTTDAGGVVNTAVAALDTTGRLIGDFGTSGKLTLSPDVTASPRALRIGDLVLRAFGTRQPDGRVVIGTANAGGGSGGGTGGGSQTPNNPTSSLRRLNVPGTRSQPEGTSLGTFGSIDGRRTTLTVTESDGTRVTFSASRGSGSAYLAGGRINLMLSDGAGGTAVSIRSSGGDDGGRVGLGDVIVSGALRSLTARTADLSGTLYASGSIGKLTLGALTGTIAAAGAITAVSLSSMTGAKVMSGAGFGADVKVGGDGADADTFTAGSVGTVRVAGAIENSTIAAGLDPVDGVFNNNDDRVNGGEQSAIRSVSARSADPTSRVIAGKIGSLRFGGAVDLETDERVRVMA